MDKLIIVKKAFELFFGESEDEDCDVDGVHIVKNKNYAEEIVPRFSDKTFKEHFRINPDVFETLCIDINTMDEHQHGPGRESISIEKQLMITLWYLGNPECMRSIGDRFGVCIASVWRIIASYCDILIKLNRVKRYIRWPTEEEAARTSAYYLRKNRFRGVIGSIDGSHIRIRTPINSPNSYVNRKGFHSVLLQGVCNHKMEFLYCYTGEAGSIHDSLLLSRSGLINKIATGDFYIHEEQHLLGDSAYPLKPWLMVPYKDNGNIRDQHKIFNRVHSKCRVKIECAFGLLKGRFRRLFSIDSLKPKSIVKYIMASCILHNICLQNNDIEDEYVTLEDDIIQDDYDDDSIDLETGHSKRESLLNSLF